MSGNTRAAKGATLAVALAVATLAALAGDTREAAAAPKMSEQWLICETGGPVIEDDENNGCCTDEDQDGYVDTCWVCDENGENCQSEELGEDLRARGPGFGSAVTVGQGVWTPQPSTVRPSRVPSLQFLNLGN